MFKPIPDFSLLPAGAARRLYFLTAFVCFLLLGRSANAQPCQGIFTFATNITPATCNAADGSILIQGVTGGTGNYSFSLFNGPPQVPGVPPLNDFLFSNLGPGTYSITISDGLCDTTITLAIASPGGITGASVSTTNPSCNATDGAINISVQPAGVTVNSYTLNTGQTSSSGNFTGLGSGNYSAILIDANNCTFTLANITLSQPPGPNNMNITASQVICKGGTGSIEVENVSGGQGPFRFSLNGAAFQNISQWNNLAPGSYLITVRDNNGCTFSKTIVIEEAENKINDCSAGADVVIDFGENVVLQGVQGSGNKLTWSPGGSLSDSTIVNPTAFPFASTVYTLTVTTPEGCTCTDRVTVRVIPLIDIPNTFTPNGDGINDTWILQFTRFYDNVEVFVYNRFGDKIYENMNYDASTEWDGTYKGAPVPPATYYYVVNFRFKDADKKFSYTGAVTVIR
jgi:gliding motility-associated-like protein